MLLWIGFALLTAGVVAALLRPLLRRSVEDDRQPADAHEADVAVYRDQLSEIDADRDRGLVTPQEAESARVELARRLLRAAGGKDNPSSAGGAKAGADRSKWAVYISGALLPLCAIAVYIATGSPELPGQPHADRVRAASTGRSLEDLVGLVEKRLREHPEDGQGWEVIAPVYVKAGRFREAADAYAQAMRLLGESPKRLLGLSEALILANNGLVVDDARKSLQRLAALDPSRPETAFWLAAAKEQDGDVAGAIADLEKLANSAPSEAPWKPGIESRIAELKEKLSAPAAAGQSAPQASGPAAPPQASVSPPAQAAPSTAPALPRGPTAAEMTAAQEMSPEQRTAMIAQMVQGLAARLDKNGKDLDGWQRLARAYKVMGRDDDARAAIAKGRTSFAGDAAAQKQLDELARSLGLGS